MASKVNAKFYLAAFAIMLLYARLDLGNSPIPVDYQVYVSWGLGVALSGLGWLLGPELFDLARNYVYKLSGKTPDKDE